MSLVPAPRRECTSAILRCLDQFPDPDSLRHQKHRRENPLIEINRTKYTLHLLTQVCLSKPIELLKGNNPPRGRPLSVSDA